MNVTKILDLIKNKWCTMTNVFNCKYNLTNDKTNNRDENNIH